MNCQGTSTIATVALGLFSALAVRAASAQESATRQRPVLVGTISLESTLFTRIVAAKLLSPTEALIIDRSGEQSRVGLRDGRAKSIARSGGGPGELSGRGASMHWVGHGLLQHDVGGMRVIRRRPNGEHVATNAVQSQTPGTAPRRQLAVGDGVVEITTPYGGRNARDPFVHVLHPRGRRVDTLASIRSDLVLVDKVWPNRTILDMESLGTGALGAWAVTPDSQMVLADGSTGWLRWLRIRNGQVQETRRARLPAQTLPGTSAEVARVLADVVQRSRRLSPSVRIVPREPHPTRSLVTDLVAMRDGTVVAAQSPFGGETLWTVIDDNARATARFSLPEGEKVQDQLGGLYLVSGVDQDQLPVLKLYRIPTSAGSSE